MITLILIILFISLLILVHEWGHFYSARRLGVRVDEFGIGFPPAIFSRVRNGVRYSFNALPFGGFVKIFGEHGEGEGKEESFVSRPIWQRFVILSAGVFMNFFLAWVLFSLGAGIGIPQISDDTASGIPVSVIGVAPGSPADLVGFRFGDQINEMRGPDGVSLRIESEKDVRDFTAAHRGEEVAVRITHGGITKEFRMIPRVSFPDGEGPLGISIARLAVARSAWFMAPVDGLRILGRSVVATAEGLWLILSDLFSKGAVPSEVSGPVGIFFFAEDTRSLGFSYFLQFIGILSVNLGFLNFLPIPALDGGRVFFLLIEKIKGSRISPKFENRIHTIGFALLILLTLLVTYHDIVQNF